MNNKHILNITWAKAFDTVYCHHASLFIPLCRDNFVTLPSLVRVGISVRTNNIEKKKIKSCSDMRKDFFLSADETDDGIVIPLLSTPIVEAIELNSWTTIKEGKRGTIKDFPLNLFYQIPNFDTVVLPFSQIQGQTPYLFSEGRFHDMKNGDKITVEIKLEKDE